MPLFPKPSSTDNGGMGRSREFDDGEVLERATRLFWERGYDTVSIQDIEAGTGIGRGSLYNAYGDKEGLFLAALEGYVARYAATPFAHLDHADVGEGIRRMLHAIVARMDDPRNPRGCLLTNTTLAATRSGSRIEARVAAAVAEMEQLLENAIERARRERQIPARTDAKALARFYAAVAQSLGLEHKLSGDRSTLESIAEVAMTAWPARRAGVARRGGVRARRRRPTRTRS